MSAKFIRETSPAVALKLIEKTVIRPRQTILEPSAGTGDIVDVIMEKYSLYNLDITCVELNEEKAKILEGKGYKTFKGDFLKLVPTQSYDQIIACPPFNDNVDLKHIKQMYEHLSPKGILVSLTSPYWITNNESHQVEFREWLADKRHDMEMLPDNSFMEKGRTVPSMILRIFKD